jgi:hypothetical protein
VPELTASIRVERSATWVGAVVEGSVGEGDALGVRLGEGVAVRSGAGVDLGDLVGSGGSVAVWAAPPGSRSTRRTSRTTLSRTNPPMATFDQLPFERSGMPEA